MLNDITYYYNNPENTRSLYFPYNKIIEIAYICEIAAD